MQVTVPPLACSDRPPQLRTTLSRIQPLFLHFHHLRTLLHHLFGFSQDKFDVAWVRHVGVDLSPTPNNQSHHQNKLEVGERMTYTTMSAIRATTLFGRLVDLNVLDDEVAGVEAFGVGVCFCVLEEAEEEFGGFFGPAGFGDAELFP